jgi:putative ABC transport system permease protein
MIQFLLKGLLRDRSRSLFPLLMVAAGVMLTVFLYSWLRGIFNDMISSTARFDTGHVKVMTRAYKEAASQIPNDLALLKVGSLLKKLRMEEPGMVWTSRIRFGGLLDIPDKNGETRAQGPVMGLAVDLLSPDSPEIKVLNLKKMLVQGRFPEKGNEIIISDGFAAKLKLKPGDTATLVGSTMNGAMAIYNFTIAGTVNFGITMLDRSMIITDLEGAREALDMEDASGEVLGFSPDMIYRDGETALLEKRFNEKYVSDKDEFSPVMVRLEKQGGLDELMRTSESIIGIIVFVFLMAMSIVLWNSGLLNGLRRYGEIGIRLAMGEPKGAIYRRMIMESVIIGLAGSLSGTLAGIGISWYLQVHPLDMGSMLQNSSIMFPSLLGAQVTATSFFIGFLPGLVAPVIGTLVAGIGIFRRQTALLFKELEV